MATYMTCIYPTTKFTTTSHVKQEYNLCTPTFSLPGEESRSINQAVLKASARCASTQVLRLGTWHGD